MSNPYNQIANKSMNQWTRAHDDSCAYINDQRILRKKLKYYTSSYWAEHPSLFTGKESFTEKKDCNKPENKDSLFCRDESAAFSPQVYSLQPGQYSDNIEKGGIQQIKYIDYTPIGNKKAFFHKGNLTYPEIGEPTSLGNKKYLQYTPPLPTTPSLGSNKTDTSTIDIESTVLNQRIGEPTNLSNNFKHATTGMDWNRWHHVDKNVIQNPDNIIFANGVIPVGGISTRNQLRNYTQTKGF